MIEPKRIDRMSTTRQNYPDHPTPLHLPFNVTQFTIRLPPIRGYTQPLHFEEFF